MCCRVHLDRSHREMDPQCHALLSFRPVCRGNLFEGKFYPQKRNTERRFGNTGCPFSDFALPSQSVTLGSRSDTYNSTLFSAGFDFFIFNIPPVIITSLRGWSDFSRLHNLSSLREREINSERGKTRVENQ
ncbi:unnamed protein product [Nesidiocoris tenuis]|uniref:Uncharacterized protein n=1 Tax=Nesidiocoris tenuis TaxID=355587 RepID=A0A6H5G9V0_9HEMI|nr:unnamed protein product [Nesidiocoris tenuis]